MKFLYKTVNCFFFIDCEELEFNDYTVLYPASLTQHHYGNSFQLQCQTGYYFAQEEFGCPGKAGI